MLLHFSVKNFRSFRDEVLLNMRRATADADTTLDLVPAAAIYGANAAGKSNLVRALDVLRDLVVHGPASKDSPLRVDPFRLASGTRGAPTEFEIYLRVGPRIYGYKVAATRAKILRERLVTVALETLEETMLFDRHQGDFEFTTTARESAGVDDPKYLDFIARGTKQNQLLVHEGHERGLSLVEDVYRWFCEALTIILPGSHFAMLEVLRFAGEERPSDPPAPRPVFVVDELNRSLHPQRLVQTFVELARESRVPGASPQLIFTTHDTNLLDCTSLSADGIWFTEKGPDGASTLYSLAEFDPEQLASLTGELAKSYLQGRFGGIPFQSNH